MWFGTPSGNTVFPLHPYPMTVPQNNKTCQFLFESKGSVCKRIDTYKIEKSLFMDVDFVYMSSLWQYLPVHFKVVLFNVVFDALSYMSM